MTVFEKLSEKLRSGKSASDSTVRELETEQDFSTESDSVIRLEASRFTVIVELK